MTSSETDVLMILFPKTSRVAALGGLFLDIQSPFVKVRMTKWEVRVLKSGGRKPAEFFEPGGRQLVAQGAAASAAQPWVSYVNKTNPERSEQSCVLSY